MLGPLRTAAPRRPALSTDHRLSRTPRPPRLVWPGRWELLPPARSSSAPPTAWARPPVPQAGVPGPQGVAPPPQALLEHQPPPGEYGGAFWDLLPPAGSPSAPTTAWAGLPVPPRWCAWAFSKQLPPARSSSPPTKELKEGLRGVASEKARAHQPRGTGSPTQAVVGAQGGPPGGSSSQQPEHTSLGGWGVLPRRWSVLKEGPRGVAVPNGLSTRAWGDGESCPGSGRCLRRACGGQQFPTARAH